MKKLIQLMICLLAVGAFAPNANAQMYESAFNRWDNSLNGGQGYANSDNLGGVLAWDESQIMMSYMTMYRHTGSFTYLDRLFEHIALVMDQRDDRANRSNYLGQQNPTWVSNTYSNNGANYGWLVHSGMITYPMADLVQEILNDPSIQGQIVPASNPVWANMTYLQAANDILGMVQQTTNYHQFQYENSTLAYNDFASNNSTALPFWLPGGTNLTCAAYKFPNDSQVGAVIGRDIKGDIVPLNHQNAMGRTLLALLQATNDPALFNQVVRIASSTKRVLWHGGASSNVFSYWGYKGFQGDDVAHAAITFDFARLCFEQGIVFDATDMTRFAYTLRYIVYANPHAFEGYLDGTSNGWYPINSGSSSMGLMAFYAQYNRDLYHIIGEEFNSSALYTAASSSAILWPHLANMATYNHLFTPAVYYNGFGPASEWVDVDGGDVDGDGQEEIVSVRAFDDDIYIHGFSENAGYHSANLVGEGNIPQQFARKWAGVAVGDFNNSSTKSEFAAISNQTGELYLYSKVGGNYYEYASSFGLADNSQWAGLAAGDFDGDSEDEIVAVRNLDGDFFMWENFSNIVSNIGTYTGFGSSSQWADIAAGDFDGNGVDEFVAIRNFDGGIHIMGYDAGAIVGIASYNGNGSASAYTGVTAGDFDDDGKDEFILHRNYDGDFYIYGLDANNNIVAEGTERFPVDQNLGALGTVNIGSRCCEELVSLRNYDGDYYVYSVGLGGCAMNKVCEYEQDPDIGRKTADPVKVEMNLFPNPAANQTKLEWRMESKEEVLIELYDLQGRKLEQLDSGEFAVGKHSVRIDRNGLAAGVYLLKIQVGAEMQIKRLVWE